MAQYRKQEIHVALCTAALQAFAELGYDRAGVDDIARRAGVSTGNVYRYFSGKEALLEAAVDDELARALERLLRQRVEPPRGLEDVLPLPMAAAYPLASEPLLAFCAEHRLEAVVLLGRARGSRHAAMVDGLHEELVRRALAHFRATRPTRRVTPAFQYALEQVHHDWLRALVGALARFEEAASFREALEALARHHVAGLRALTA